LEERFDPLAVHRPALGGERAAWIERHAERFATALAKMDGTRLRAERAEAGEPFARLDQAGARRTLALQRDRASIEAEVERAERHAESLVEQASRLRGRDRREEREALLEVAATQGRLAEEDREWGEALRAEEDDLHRDGIHLDDWMRKERDAAARHVALERELFARRRGSLKDDLEAVLREPPADIVELIGPAPEVEDPAREEWEEVVTELEIHRMIAEGELPAAAPGRRERRDLERRIEDLRELRNADLGPEPAPATAPEIEVE
jgi:hypothetical protein